MGSPFVTMQALLEQHNLKNLTEKIDLNTVKVYHRNVNRPQLFLAGFEGHFDNERIQILGGAEEEYLMQFPKEQRISKYRRLLTSGIPGVIICAGITSLHEIVDVADEINVPVLFSEKSTAGVMVDVISWINEQLAPMITMHGVLVDVYGEGILITGDSGIGKSETAVELVKRGHRLVADDLVEMIKVGETLIVGRAPELTKHLVELRGIGVVDIKSLYGVESVKDRSPIDMIINLEEWNPDKNYDRLGLNEEYANIIGVEIVKHTVPIRTGRNLAIIIETAAVNNRQKKMGYNAAQELCDRVAAQIHQQNNK